MMSEVQMLLKELQQYDKKDRKLYNEKCIEIIKVLLKSGEIYTILNKNQMENNVATPLLGKNNQNFPSIWLFSRKEYAQLFAKTYEFVLDGRYLVAKLDFKETFEILLNFVFQGGHNVIIDDGQFNLTAALYDVVNECFLMTNGRKFIEKEQYGILHLLNMMFYSGRKVWLIPNYDVSEKPVINNSFIPLNNGTIKVFSNEADVKMYSEKNNVDKDWALEVSMKVLVQIMRLCHENKVTVVEVFIKEETLAMELDKLLAIIQKMQNTEIIVLRNYEKNNLEKVEPINKENKTAPEEKKVETNALSENILMRLDTIQKVFDETIKHEKYRDALLDNFYKDFSQYKNGLIDKAVDPLVIELIKILETTKKAVSIYETREYSEDNYLQLLGMLKGMTEEVKDSIYRQGVKAYSIPSEEVDVTRQNVISLQETNDENLDSKIAVRLGEGYEKNGRVLVAERVSVYKYIEEEQLEG